MSENILDSMTEEQIISAGMRLLGMRTSKRKAKSSAKNGKLAWSKKRKLRTTFTKRNAYDATSVAIRNGTLKRGLCKVCASPKTEAHHHNYQMPLDVIWLCKKHHEEHHKNNRK